jgi:hypothetical protein
VAAIRASWRQVTVTAHWLRYSERRFDVTFDHSVRAHEVGGGAVVVGALQFALQDLRIDLEALASRVVAQAAKDPFELLGAVGAPHEVAGHERARVDHRVVRTVVALVEDDRVERVAAGLHPHPFEDVLAPVILERESVDEDLGHGLKRERGAVVADALKLAVGRDQGDGELVVSGARQIDPAVAASRLVEGRDVGELDVPVAVIELPQAPIDALVDIASEHAARPS